MVDVYLAELARDALVIADKATIRDPLNGRRRPLKKYDLDNVFNRAVRLANGHYRVLVSRFAPGKPLGNFRYYSRRPDDPNDLVAHEHRRELRGARVFGAWLNHDDSRGINSLDMLETTNGRGWINHSDPAATDYLIKTIIERRNKVVRAWINQVCPVDDAALS